MADELRCANKLHGVMVTDNVIEIKCNSRFCGARPGVTVRHQFSTATGELLETEIYKNPPQIVREDVSTR